MSRVCYSIVFLFFTVFFRLAYNVATDEYQRPNDSTTSKGYKSLAHDCSNVFRKVEADWKKVYLCRTEGSEKGEIVWKVNFAGQKPTVAEVDIGAPFTNNDGDVLAVVCCGGTCRRISSDGKVKLENIEGAEYLELRVEFTGGKGNTAWQQAQLFRADLDNTQANFSIRVEFA